MWHQGELKFKIKRTRNVFSVLEGEAMTAGMLAMSLFKQEVMYMEQHTVVHLTGCSAAHQEGTWDC